MSKPEEHNLEGWLTELADLTTAEQCNDLFEVLLVDQNKAEFERRVRRVISLAAHVRSYDVESEEWQMAVREHDHIDSTTAVAAYELQIAPAFERTKQMRDIVDIFAISHFRTKLRLAVLQSEDALESSTAIDATHNIQPTQLGQHPFNAKIQHFDEDAGGDEMKRAA
jgi:methionyl-tRNA synthetase